MKSTDSLGNWLQHLEQTRLHLVTDKKSGAEDLTYAKKITNYLQLNPFNCPVISVAGTNGKGSCVAAMENILLSADYQIAAVTSPHLLSFTERLRINGENIKEEIICQTFHKLTEIERLFDKQLYYYRFIHLAFFYICYQAKLDVVVFEAGIGGRCDSVNLIDADIAVVTSIGLDHCAILGDTREKIAYEKAGIFRKNKAVVSGVTDGEVLLKPFADQLACDFYQYGKDFVGKDDRQALSRNKAVAIKALSLLPDRLSCTGEQINEGLRQLVVPGRQEYIPSVPPRLAAHLLDVAHNPEAVRELTERIKSLAVLGKKHAIFTAMHDKNIQKMIEEMLPMVDVWYIPDFAGQRIEQASKVIDMLRKVGIEALHFSSLKAAYEAAKRSTKADDLIIGFGSFKVIAALKKVMV